MSRIISKSKAQIGSSGSAQQRTSANNNINININFNMKDKSNGLVGKKIDNYMQVISKPKTDLIRPNICTELYKNKKKNLKQKQKQQIQGIISTANQNDYGKIRKKKSKSKFNTNQFTPEKKKIKQERSRSKINEKKNNKIGLNNKSTKNIRMKQDIIKNNISNENSRSKQRSHSQSSKKLVKGLNVCKFQNSGIKYKIDVQGSSLKSGKKLRQSMLKFNDHESNRINQFIEKKKKKYKRQKIKEQKQKKQTQIKIKEKLKKIEIDRKNMVGKIMPIKKTIPILTTNKQPLFFENDQDEQQYLKQKHYNKFMIEAQTLMLQQDRNIKKYYNQNNQNNKNNFNNIQQQQQQAVIKIQSYWRGYKVRKNFINELNFLSNQNKIIWNRVNENNNKYWQQQSSNSIKHIKGQEIDIDVIKLKDIDQIQEIEENDNNNHNNNNNNHNNNNDNHNHNHNHHHNNNNNHNNYNNHNNNNNNTSQEEQEQELNIHNKLKYQNLIVDQDNFHKENQGNIISLDMMNEYQKLKQDYEKQNKRVKLLEVQNQNLKANIININLKSNQINEQANIDQCCNEQQKQQHESMEIKMPQKINNFKGSKKKDNNDDYNNNDKNCNEDKDEMNSYKNQGKIKIKKKIQLTNEVGIQIQDWKKQMQAYNCSPSQKRMQYFKKNLKSSDIKTIFEQKVDIIKNQYKTKFETVQQLLKDHLISPRSYNNKKIQLQQIYLQNKNIIQTRLQQAVRVVQFINQDKNHFIHDKNIINSPINNSIKIKQYWNHDTNQSHQRILQVTKQINKALQQSNSFSVLQEYKNQFDSNSLQCNSNYNSKKNKQNSSKQSFQNNQQLLQSDVSNQNDEAFRIYQQINQKPIQQQQQNVCQEQKCSNQSNRQNSLNMKVNVQKSQQLQSFLEINSPVNICQSFQIKPNENKNQIQLFQSQKTQQQQQQLYEQAQLQLQNNIDQCHNLKGFSTTLTFIREYTIALCEFIRNDEQFCSEFQENITTPITYDNFQLLRSYRTTLQKQNNSQYNSHFFDLIYPYFHQICPKITAISPDLLGKFNEFYQQHYPQQGLYPQQNYQQTNASSTLEIQQQNLTLELKQYFISSVIDAFNESLNYQRPCSYYGKNVPWICNSRELKNKQNLHLRHCKIQREQEDNQNTQQHKLDQIFGIGIARLIQWGSGLCGFFPDPITLQMDHNQVIQIDEEQTNNIRENRMALMLEKALYEEEEKMIDHKIEETQVKLYLSEHMISIIIAEVIEDLKNINL